MTFNSHNLLLLLSEDFQRIPVKSKENDINMQTITLRNKLIGYNKYNFTLTYKNKKCILYSAFHLQGLSTTLDTIGWLTLWWNLLLTFMFFCSQNKSIIA